MHMHIEFNMHSFEQMASKNLGFPFLPLFFVFHLNLLSLYISLVSCLSCVAGGGNRQDYWTQNSRWELRLSE